MTSILITAPTSQSGKTTLARSLAHNIANNSNKSVEVFIPSSESHNNITSNLETTFLNLASCPSTISNTCEKKYNDAAIPSWLFIN